MIQFMRWMPDDEAQAEADAQDQRNVEMWEGIKRWGRPRPCALCGGTTIVMAYGAPCPCPKCVE